MYTNALTSKEDMVFGCREQVIKEVFELELIQCMRQPGNLRITKEACALQYKRAQERRLKKGKGAFYTDIYSSLEVCRKCPQGRCHFEKLGEKLRRTKNHHISIKKNKAI